MSFQNKGFWMAKSTGHENDGDATFGNPSRTEPKRSQQWFVDSADPQMFPNKKQTVHIPNSKLSMEMPNENVSWESPSSFHSAPHQFMDRLFGSDTTSSTNFDRNVSAVGVDDWSIRTKGIDNQFREDAPVNLSISHAIENPELGFAGIRKIKVNQVKDNDNGMHVSREHGSSREYNINLPTSQAFDRTHEASFISAGQAYDKEHENVTLMGHAYNQGALGANYGKREENVLSMSDSYSKGNASMISLGGFPNEQAMNTMGRAIGNYDRIYHQSSVQTSETVDEKELDTTNVNAVDNTASVLKAKPESASKSKPESRPKKKQAPNSFPSNVRSLISTGILDGVPVKYVSMAREELRGVIKGTSYLCGCESCNFTKKGINAYVFEQHAGCKTKHPNNHIYFENGKTIYQVVQELRSTPESLLFDTMQTIFGAPINQKAFLSWKESFQAATRELERIYGKEELNL